VIAGRYEHKATIITSNKSLSDWSRVLHDSPLAAALIDRLMHHGEVFYLKGESYRLKDKRGLALGKEPVIELTLLLDNRTRVATTRGSRLTTLESVEGAGRPRGHDWRLALEATHSSRSERRRGHDTSSARRICLDRP